MLSDISADVNSAVVGPGGFKARAGIIATWHLVTFKGASCLATTQTCIVSIPPVESTWRVLGTYSRGACFESKLKMQCNYIEFYIFILIVYTNNHAGSS